MYGSTRTDSFPSKDMVNLLYENPGVEKTHLESVQLFLKNSRIVSKTFKARELSCGSDISFSPTN